MNYCVASNKTLPPSKKHGCRTLNWLIIGLRRTDPINFHHFYSSDFEDFFLPVAVLNSKSVFNLRFLTRKIRNISEVLGSIQKELLSQWKQQLMLAQIYVSKQKYMLLSSLLLFNLSLHHKMFAIKFLPFDVQPNKTNYYVHATNSQNEQFVFVTSNVMGIFRCAQIRARNDVILLSLYNFIRNSSIHWTMVELNVPLACFSAAFSCEQVVIKMRKFSKEDKIHSNKSFDDNWLSAQNGDDSFNRTKDLHLE